MANMEFPRGLGPRGIGFPISKGRDGYFPRRNAAALRRTSIMLIMGTRPGERVMRPTFGSQVHSLYFEPNDDILLQELVEETKDAIQRWDPYIKVIGVAPEAEQNSIRLFIDYVDTRDPNAEPRRLVYNVKRV